MNAKDHMFIQKYFQSWSQVAADGACSTVEILLARIRHIFQLY
jgi:hypothetical protein